MKKIILLFLILLLTGCYDYNELTDLGIVSSMIIDYKNDEFVVNVEILDTNKEITNPSYFISGVGKTFEEALANLYNKSDVHIYLHHMNVVIVSKSVASNKLKNLYDYFLRDPDIRKDSYFIISDNVDEILKYKTVNNNNIGDSIKNIIKYNEKNNSKFATSKFYDILHAYLNNMPYLLGNVVIENNVLLLKDTYVIDNNQLSIDLDETLVLYNNVLKNNSLSFIVSSNTDNYEIYKYKTNIEIKDNKIIIHLVANMRLLGMNNKPSKSQKDIIKQESIVYEILKKDLDASINYAKKQNIDFYNFNFLYCNNEPSKCESNSWVSLTYDCDIKVLLNERGLILNTLKEEATD